MFLVLTNQTAFLGKQTLVSKWLQGVKYCETFECFWQYIWI